MLSRGSYVDWPAGQGPASAVKCNDCGFRYMRHPPLGFLSSGSAGAAGNQATQRRWVRCSGDRALPRKPTKRTPRRGELIDLAPLLNESTVAFRAGWCKGTSAAIRAYLRTAAACIWPIGVPNPSPGNALPIDLQADVRQRASYEVFVFTLTADCSIHFGR